MGRLQNSVFILFISLQLITADVNIDDCGVTKGCFLYPDNCNSKTCIFVYKWNDLPTLNATRFELNFGASTGNLDWMAIGFSYDNQMGKDCVVLCNYNESSVNHYYNAIKDIPDLLDADNPSVGLSNSSIKYANGVLTCSFQRNKTFPGVTNYYDLNLKYNILAAHGHIEMGDGYWFLTIHDTKVPTDVQIDFSQDGVISGSNSFTPMLKAHGCIMVVAWTFLATLGILSARYYKYIFPGKKIFGQDIWFIIHRPVMILVWLCSVVAFFLALSDLKWSWVSSFNRTAFYHSICGIITISLATIQPFIALFRCNKDDANRYIFNFVHRSIGLTTLVLATVTIFLGTLIDITFLGDTGWNIMTGWVAWIIVLVLCLEIFTYILKKNDQNVQAQKYKSILLFPHIIVAIAFVAVLCYYIIIAKEASPPS